MTKLLIIVSVLTSFLTNMETKTFRSAFNISVSEDQNAAMKYPGSITMNGQRFRLEVYDIQAAYDGKTLYMYSFTTDELTLSNPSQQELLEANPFLYAKALMPVCDIVEKKSHNGLSTHITLTPKDQSIGIDRFVLIVRDEDLMPLRVTIKEGTKKTTLEMLKPKFVTTEYEYKIEPKKDTYINDMRL